MLASDFVLPSLKRAVRKGNMDKEAMAVQASASATAVKLKRQKE